MWNMTQDSETPRYGVVMVTAAHREQAEKIAKALVKAKLAACVNFTQVHSIYSWQGDIHYDDEWQLFIKTDLDKFAQVEAKVKEVHSYEVPEIIALPIVAGSESYLQWIRSSVGENC
jgi:periplasmic divalent cation tolerance protein